MWDIPRELVASQDDAGAIEIALAQLQDPQQFLGKIEELLGSPERRALTFWL